MTETFTKLFSSIISSSIWSEDDHTRIVWITMLAMADRNGYVGASKTGLARMAQVPRSSVEVALEKFLAPDPDSRSQEFEGRRIEVADRGWTVLNHERFRDMRDEEARKEYERDRKRRQRAAKQVSADGGTVPDSPGHVPVVTTSPLLSAHADADADADADAAQRQSTSPAAVLPSGTVLTGGRKRGRGVAAAGRACQVEPDGAAGVRRIFQGGRP